MAKSANWALVDLAARSTGASILVRINEQVIPVAQLSMTYGLNAIPVAHATVALGRQARTGLESPVYKQIAQIKQMTEVEIILVGSLGDFTAGATGAPHTQFPTVKPEAPAVLFMGYVSGLSYRRSAGRVTLVINMVHKLFDLSTSSAGSKDVVPGAPHDFMLPIVSEGPGADNIADPATKFMPMLTGGGGDDATSMNEDFSNSLLSCIEYIAKNDFLQTHNADLWCGGDSQKEYYETNEQILQLLEDPGEPHEWQGIATFSKSKYMGKYTVNYGLQVNSLAQDKAALAIASQLASSLAPSSMWASLISTILPEFGCGIIPMAKGAILAPILPMASQHQIVISPGDYADFNLTTSSQRPLFGVGVLGNFVLGTVNPDNPKMCVGASFVARANNKAKFADGMWLFVPAPRWLDGLSDFDPEAGKGDAAVNKVMSKESHTTVGGEKIAVERDPSEDVEKFNKELGKYAQMMYASQALRGREGTLTGKLRFDIAPATTIKIQAKGDELSEGIDTLATDMYAFVAKVTITINAEQASAATTLELTNLRTAEENAAEATDDEDNGRFAFKKHPFFQDDYFKYAPIVPELSL